MNISLLYIGAWLIMLLIGQGKKHASSRPLMAKAQLGDGTSGPDEIQPAGWV